MTPLDEYTKALDKAISDLSTLVQRRDLLTAEIAGLRETVRVLSSRVKLAPDKQREITQLLAMIDYATPNLTDAIRSLLIKLYPKQATAIEVRNALEESGFNFDDFSNSLSACHSALKRLEIDNDIEKGTPKDGKTSYRAVLKIPTQIVANNLVSLLGETWSRPKTMADLNPDSTVVSTPAQAKDRLRRVLGDRGNKK